MIWDKFTFNRFNGIMQRRAKCCAVFVQVKIMSQHLIHRLDFL